MRAFNAFQMVGIFVAWPFLIAWLRNAEFSGAAALFYASAALYVVGFFFMVASVCSLINEIEGRRP
jgi:hypothetical protein